MEIGMVGLGKMGLNMARRLLRAGHQVVGYNRSPDEVAELEKDGGRGTASLESLVAALAAPRIVWLMIPSGKPVDDTIEQLMKVLEPGDMVVDGGNSNYKDSMRRGETLRAAGFGFADAGTSGGIWGLENGYCIMIGGEKAAIRSLTPALDALSPEGYWQHVGPVGAGHFSKMVHNGIEYGMMQAYSEGFDLLQASDFGYDLARISNLWSHGSVVRSWLLELAERAFTDDPKMEKVRGYVNDSGEGRWTILESVERGVATPVLAMSLYARFSSRDENAFGNRVLASLRNQFGGHAVKAAGR
jgi:6-phosphogluconate dehydrogenase